MHRSAALASLRLGLLLLLAGSTSVFAACPPEGWDRTRLQALKQSGFELAPEDLGALAQALPACLSDPAPELRDGIAFEALSHWMRAGQLSAEQLRTLRAPLLAQLQTPDPQGVGAPFAALVLAELSRTDRIAAWMEPAERAQLVEAAVGYLRSVRDYRGFEAGVGWRHGVAHGADWVLQLGLNPALELAHLEVLREALASQVLAADGHAYVFNEPARLATPLLFIARRQVFSDEDWQTWLAQFPPRLGPAAEIWSTPDALAARHNLQAFLLVLHFEASRSEDPGMRSLLPGVLAALKAMP